MGGKGVAAAVVVVGWGGADRKDPAADRRNFQKFIIADTAVVTRGALQVDDQDFITPGDTVGVGQCLTGSVAQSYVGAGNRLHAVGHPVGIGSTAQGGGIQIKIRGERN